MIWRSARVLVVSALLIQFLSLGVRMPLALVVSMHMATFLVFGAFFVRVAQHHWLHRPWVHSEPPWDPMAPRRPFPARAVILIGAAIANVIGAAVIASTPLLSVDPALGVHPFEFAAVWALFALVVVVCEPTVARRIAAKKRK